MYELLVKTRVGGNSNNEFKIIVMYSEVWRDIHEPVVRNGNIIGNCICCTRIKEPHIGKIIFRKIIRLWMGLFKKW